MNSKRLLALQLLLACLSIAHAQSAGVIHEAKGSKTMESSEEKLYIRFGQHAEAAMLKSKVETSQDEVALFSSLLIQDALSDQKLPQADIEGMAALVQKHLCEGKQPDESHCGNVKKSIATIRQLYGSKALSPEATSGAVTALMSAVVHWLDRNPG